MSPNVTIRQLRAFVAVARHRSFTGAARSLVLTQPAVTLNVQQLEGHFGASLFDRSSRQVALTKDGVAFLPVAERLLGQFDAVMKDAEAMGDPHRGHAFISCPTSLTVRLLLPILRRQRTLTPGVKLSLREDDGAPAHKLVRDGAVDFAVSGSWEPDSDLSFTPLFHDRCCIVCPPGHQLAKVRRPVLDDLTAFPFIGTTAGTTTRRLVDAAVAQSGVRLEVACEVAHLMTLFEMIAAGLGISILPALAAQMGMAHSLVVKPLAQPLVWRGIGLVSRNGRTLSPSAKIFWDGLVEEAALRRAELEAPLGRPLRRVRRPHKRA